MTFSEKNEFNNSLKKGEGVPLLNLGGGPGVPLLNFERGPGVPLSNFRGILGPRFQGLEVPGPRGLVPLLHHAAVESLLLILGWKTFTRTSCYESPSNLEQNNFIALLSLFLIFNTCSSASVVNLEHVFN